ncbi:hypothetical protein D5B42_23290 [Salmonella enterica subsp. enterica serovar Oranienburg]|nr:hypothetical protein [Salmonella enterica subsp. enterica serovar Oranienburg]
MINLIKSVRDNVSFKDINNGMLYLTLYAFTVYTILYVILYISTHVLAVNKEVFTTFSSIIFIIGVFKASYRNITEFCTHKDISANYLERIIACVFSGSISILIVVATVKVFYMIASTSIGAGSAEF